MYICGHYPRFGVLIQSISAHRVYEQLVCVKLSNNLFVHPCLHPQPIGDWRSPANGVLFALWPCAPSPTQRKDDPSPAVKV